MQKMQKMQKCCWMSPIATKERCNFLYAQLKSAFHSWAAMCNEAYSTHACNQQTYLMPSTKHALLVTADTYLNSSLYRYSHYFHLLINKWNELRIG